MRVLQRGLQVQVSEKNKVFSRSEINKSFGLNLSRTELENHMKSAHNTSGKHKCLICDDVSPSATLLAEHKLTHCKIGLSSECCYCQETLCDSAAFKNHLREHNSAEFPIQCIGCRQTLNSDFEIGLHAKWV